MDEMRLLRYRLAAHRFGGETKQSVTGLVAHMGAVQAQDLAAARWALGLRTQLSDESIKQASDDGAILRTHVLRPTWHFVSPQDIHWLLSLSAPRVNALSTYYYRQFDLDDAVFQKASDLICRHLRDGVYATRKELNVLLTEHGFGKSLQRHGLIIMHAELSGIICSGPLRGKQTTYALLEERVPHTTPFLSNDESLTRLALLYFKSHGPATLRDFIWWSGLSIRDAKLGLDMAKAQLETCTTGANEYWFDGTLKINVNKTDEVLLLQNYDEYLVSYADRGLLIDSQDVQYLDPTRPNLLFYNCIIFRGKVAGTWQRTIQQNKALVNWRLFRPSPALVDALDRALKEYELFLSLPIEASRIE